jgi:hypothetical protein
MVYVRPTKLKHYPSRGPCTPITKRQPQHRSKPVEILHQRDQVPPDQTRHPCKAIENPSSSPNMIDGRRIIAFAYEPEPLPAASCILARLTFSVSTDGGYLDHRPDTHRRGDPNTFRAISPDGIKRILADLVQHTPRSSPLYLNHASQTGRLVITNAALASTCPDIQHRVRFTNIASLIKNGNPHANHP